MNVVLKFERGTLVAEGAEPLDGLRADPRTGAQRGDAMHYRAVRLALKDHNVVDEAARYEKRTYISRLAMEPRDYQLEAADAWRRARGQGLVVLPTGAGKTFVALLAMQQFGRDTLVIAPTLDLVQQWHDLMVRALGLEVGVVGGGSHEIRPVTITTYDSAYLHMEHLGGRFGLVIFDEVHHLPSVSYANIARMSIAPFRLGLSATPERLDGRDNLLDELVGPIVYRKDTDEMAGTWLAPYDAVRVPISLTDEERILYEDERAIYLSFLRANGIRLRSARDFSTFLMRAAGHDEGERALTAYRTQRALARAASQKIEETERLLDLHKDERAIIFTDDNATAYTISRQLLVPVITHQTKVKERSAILNDLKEGRIGAVVTSRVLNEGVDVPEASVAIVVSGSGSVREHVQRLGRVLRKDGDRRAVLYELVSDDTNESGTSDRRREHVAFTGREDDPC